MAKLYITSFERSSVFRQFLVFFLLSSIIPLVVLFYLYTQIAQSGRVTLSPRDLQNALLWVAAGSGAGYFALRRLIQGFVRTTQISQRALSEVLKKRAEGRAEGNEIVSLSQTFSDVISQLEEDRRNLELAKKTLHSVLSELSVGLAGSGTADHFLHMITETVTEAVWGKMGVLLMADKEGKHLTLKYVVGKSPDAFRDLRFRMEGGFFAPAVKSKNGIVLSSSAGQEVPTDVPAGLLEFPVAAAPLMLHDKTIGILAVCGRRVDTPFQEEDLNVIYNVALQAAVAVDTEQVRHLATVDPLTNLFNRRYLTEILDYEVARSARYGGDLCLLMMDIDDFKQYNDAFGHLEGDALLQAMGKALQRCLRATDTVCRYGGDEFVVILPQTSLEAVRTVAARIHAAAQGLQLKRPVTVSIGGTQWTAPLTRTQLVTKADDALYQAKKEGKNKVALI